MVQECAELAEWDGNTLWPAPYRILYGYGNGYSGKTKPLKEKIFKGFSVFGTPTGNRTPVTAVKGRCPNR